MVCMTVWRVQRLLRGLIDELRRVATEENFLWKIRTAHWKCGWNGTLLTRHFTDAALYDKHCLFVHS